MLKDGFYEVPRGANKNQDTIPTIPFSAFSKFRLENTSHQAYWILLFAQKFMIRNLLLLPLCLKSSVRNHIYMQTSRRVLCLIKWAIAIKPKFYTITVFNIVLNQRLQSQILFFVLLIFDHSRCIFGGYFFYFFCSEDGVEGLHGCDTPSRQLEQRFFSETPNSAQETCIPQPSQVALSQLGHETRLHIFTNWKALKVWVRNWGSVSELVADRFANGSCEFFLLTCCGWNRVFIGTVKWMVDGTIRMNPSSFEPNNLTSTKLMHAISGTQNQNTEVTTEHRHHFELLVIHE